MHLAWTAGESFTLKDDRDYVAEVFSLLDDGELRTKKEIATGIKAGEKAVAEVLTTHPEAIETLTGEAAKAAGRHPSSVVYRKVRSALNAPNAPTAFSGGVEGSAALLPPLKGAAAAERTPAADPEGAPAAQMHLDDQARADELWARHHDGEDE
jgi:hypothetical protein